LPALKAGFFWRKQGQISQLRHKLAYRIRMMGWLYGFGPYPIAVLPRGIPMLTMFLLISGYRLGSLLKPSPKV
jgi:hypothetical protein